MTSLTTTQLGGGGGEGGERTALVFSTINGSIGTLCPLGSAREKEILTALEASLLKSLAGPTLDSSLFPTGRDPITYRSTTHPAKGVIDLDLIEQAGPVRRAQAAKDAKMDAKEVESVVLEVLGTMCLAWSE